MHLTWFDNNSWLIEMAGARVLLDPWLVGDLVFGNAPWFFRGVHRQSVSIPDNLSLILLSQGLPDHAHPETLSQLDRSIPVVGSASAAKVAESLGFTSVTALKPSETFTWQHTLTIQAFPGAPLGPQELGNAYLLQDLHQHTTLYYEPHGYHSASLQGAAPVDVAVIPLIDLNLPLLGAFIRGGDRALELIQRLHPQVVLPTTMAAETQYDGLIQRLISSRGSVDEFCDRLHAVVPTTQVLEPVPGARITIPLQAKQPNLKNR
ncbi:MAG: MBL fold metallo-hydrolase [Thermosynechococcaceae cyanobacterium]